MSEIRVEVDKIRSENAALASAIDTFREYDKDYIEKMVSSLDSMHSDYINLLKKTMKNMADTIAPQMVKQAEAYSKAIKNAVDTFEAGDEAISGELKKRRKE